MLVNSNFLIQTLTFSLVSRAWITSSPRCSSHFETVFMGRGWSLCFLHPVLSISLEIEKSDLFAATFHLLFLKNFLNSLSVHFYQLA